MNPVTEPHRLCAASRIMKNHLRHWHAVLLGKDRAVQQVNAPGRDADLDASHLGGKELSKARGLDPGHCQGGSDEEWNTLIALQAGGQNGKLADRPFRR